MNAFCVGLSDATAFCKRTKSTPLQLINADNRIQQFQMCYHSFDTPDPT